MKSLKELAMLMSFGVAFTCSWGTVLAAAPTADSAAVAANNTVAAPTNKTNLAATDAANKTEDGTALRLKRSYLILNLTDMNDLPTMDRWLFKEHANDTVSINGSILSGYSTYRALPIPRGGEKYGAYNWRMTEHHWMMDPFSLGSELNQGTGYTEVWPKNYNRMIGNPTNSDKRADWSAQDNKNAHAPAFVFTNRNIDDDFKGAGKITSDDGPFFRFVFAMKYPDGVSQEEGERWFYNSFIPAMQKQNDLLRGFSYKAISPHVTPFTRIVELWYRDANAWTRNWVDGNPGIAAPTWAASQAQGNGMYLTPYKDMVSIFLEESPERDFLKQGTAYYTDN